MAKSKSSIDNLLSGNLDSKMNSESIRIQKAREVDLKKFKKEQHIDEFLDVNEIIIDPELQTLIRFHTEEEFAQFKENLISDGKVREPIIVTNSLGDGYTLVDGHHRLKGSKELAEINKAFREIPVMILPFESKEAILIWMLRNQLGRRNLTKAERFDIAIKLEDLGYFRKIAAENKGKRNDLTSLSIDNKVNKVSKRVVNQIADTANISTIDAARFKKVKESDPDIYKEVLEGNRSVSNAYNEIIAKDKLTKKQLPKKSTKKLTKVALFELLQSKKIVLDIALLIDQKATALNIRFTQLKYKDHIVQAIKPHYKNTDVLIVGYSSSIEGITDKLQYCNFVFYVTDQNETFNLPEKVGLLFINEQQEITISKSAEFNNVADTNKVPILIDIIGFLLS